jgi:glycosyltransferase involved in cell wall biosynthesis
MHILHVHDRLSARGGADIHLLAITERQARHHRVHLAVGRVDPGMEPPQGVQLHRLPGLGGRERSAPAAARALRRLCAQLGPQLLHMHNILQPAVMEMVPTLAPAVVTVQDHRSFCPGRGLVLPSGQPCPGGPSQEACEACFDDPDYADMITGLTARRLAALRRFPGLVVLSTAMARRLVATGIEPERIAVVPPFPWSPAGARAPELSLPSGPLALAAGRLVWAKGFHLLLEAWALLEHAPPLILLGEGPARAALEAQAATLGLAPPRLCLAGWLPRPEVEALLQRAQLAIMPSLWAEPFGIWGLEAQARGVPVVAFDTGGVTDWLHPEHGWLAPPADIGALAAALQQACDPALARERGDRAARFVAQHFQPRALMDRLEAVYRRVLDLGPAGG